MILLIGLNPRGFPIRSALLGGNVADLSHGCESHTFSSMLGFPPFHVVGDTNVDQFITLVALILVGVSFL